MNTIWELYSVIAGLMIAMCMAGEMLTEKPGERDMLLAVVCGALWPILPVALMIALPLAAIDKWMNSNYNNNKDENSK